MRTLFGTFKLGCGIYTVLSIIITVIVVVLVITHSHQIATPPELPIP